MLVPQYLLEAAIGAGRGAVTHIICTQPRRIAAVSVAERVAAERGEPAPGKRYGQGGLHGPSPADYSVVVESNKMFWLLLL
eukprot:scaffold32227_cov47-Prasinocladus_malaysianus.AAC.1